MCIAVLAVLGVVGGCAVDRGGVRELAQIPELLATESGPVECGAGRMVTCDQCHWVEFEVGTASEVVAGLDQRFFVPAALGGSEREGTSVQVLTLELQKTSGSVCVAWVEG